MEEHHFYSRFQHVAGVSGGSIVAALYAAGYTAEEMRDHLLNKDFSEFLYLSDRNPKPDLITPQELESINLLKIIKILIKITWHKPDFWSKNGVYITDKIYDWINELLGQRNITTFESLKDVNLTIIGANIKSKEHIIFNQHNYRNTDIAEAVRCSISIPFFFEPVSLGRQIVVDGGILTTFPISIFFQETRETIGFKFEPEQPTQNNNLHPTVEYLECFRLNIIDRLWTRYSDGRFGFSPQKKVWDNVGKPGMIGQFFSFDDIGKRCFEFGREVGWIELENFLSPKFLFFLAPQNPQTMIDKITQARNNIKEIPTGYLPNFLLTWVELDSGEQFKNLLQQLPSFVQGASFLLPALYDRL